MPTLGEIPFLDGPYLELDDPTPAIERPDVLIPIAAALHVPTNTAASNQLNALSALQSVLAGQVSVIGQHVGPADVALLSVPAGDVGNELDDLVDRETKRGAIDQALRDLAALDPADAQDFEIIFDTPELPVIIRAYLDGLTLWDGAFPLWPFGQ